MGRLECMSCRICALPASVRAKVQDPGRRVQVSGFRVKDVECGVPQTQ